VRELHALAAEHGVVVAGEAGDTDSAEDTGEVVLAGTVASLRELAGAVESPTLRDALAVV